MGTPKKIGKYIAWKSHYVSEYFYNKFQLETVSMPPEPKMCLGEEVKTSGQWRVVAVPFGCAFGVGEVWDRGGTVLVCKWKRGGL